MKSQSRDSRRSVSRRCKSVDATAKQGGLLTFLRCGCFAVLEKCLPSAARPSAPPTDGRTESRSSGEKIGTDFCGLAVEVSPTGTRGLQICDLVFASPATPQPQTDGLCHRAPARNINDGSRKIGAVSEPGERADLKAAGATTPLGAVYTLITVRSTAD